MVTGLRRASLGYLARHRWHTALTILGIALGVAVVTSVDLANQSAARAFRLSMEQITGKATHHLVGGPRGLDESLYVDLRVRGALRNAAPIIEGPVTLSGRNFTLLGVDPIAERAFPRPGLGEGFPDVSRLLIEPGALLMGPRDAQELGLLPGAQLTLESGAGHRQGVLLGVLERADPIATQGLLVADIATAQEILGRTGSIDRVDLVLDESGASALAGALPKGLRLEPSGSRSRAKAELSRAFQINLTALSLLALLVGGLLIYNTLTFSILQRRPMLAALRIVGVTRSQIFSAVMAEALTLALIGTLLGVALGIFVAEGLVRLVTRTINDLYYVLHVRSLILDPWSLLKGLALGLTATVVAAAGPAAEAINIPPAAAQRRSLVELRSHRVAPWLALLGLGLGVSGWGLAQIPEQPLALGFVALFMLIIGYSLAVPLALLALSRYWLPLWRRFSPRLGPLAVRGVTSGLSRTGLAIAALSVAVSATVGMGIMVESFRASVAEWLGYTLQADIYVSARQRISSRADGELNRELIERLKEIPGIVDWSEGRRIEIDTRDGAVELLALDMAAASHRGYRFTGPTDEELWPLFGAGQRLLVSEPWARHNGLSVGDEVRLLTPVGETPIAIGGIFYEYGSSRGLLVLDRTRYQELWNDPGVSTVGLYLRPGTNAAGMVAAVREALGPMADEVRIRSNRAIREQSLEIFDRTFTVTRVLRLLAIGVAFIGVLSAWLALFLERRREHAILRAIGITPGELLRLIALQTLLMGLAAGLLALPLGWLMAHVLIDVINLRSFGWSMVSQTPPDVLFGAVLLAVGASILAALYPAWQIARAHPAAALREE